MLARTLKPLLLGQALLLSLVAAAAAEPPGQSILRPGDRLAICGDGMTSQLGYSVYIEDYLLVSQPIREIEVSQFGWHSATASQFVTHLAADVLPFKPTIVMTCFGMHDGGYKALEADTAEQYRQAQTEAVQALKKAGVRLVIVGSPRSVDPATFHNDHVSAEVYNKTLAALADIDREVAAHEGAIYADVFGATRAAMQKAKALFGESYAYDPEDGNKDAKSSLVVAYAFLKTLGLDGDIGTITADFAASRAETTPEQRVVSFDDYKLTVESRRYPFWFPAYPSGDTLADPILKCLPFNQELTRYTLVVKNLPTARAKIFWQDDCPDFSAPELARGINLTEHFRATPFAGKMQDVDNAVRDQQQQERISGSQFVQTGVPDLAGMAQRDLVRRRADERFKPVTHTIRIQPLAEPEKQPPGPIPVIVDTDMSSDCDDAGAVALLNTFMNQGEAKLLACVGNGHDVDLSIGATIQAINTYYGHPAIPIGTYHGTAGFGPSGSQYTKKIHERFAPDFPSDDKLPAGVDIYRRALASAADGTVVICSLGFLQNLTELVKSPPDAVSNLAGLDLVRKKVRQIVIMNNQQKEDEFVLANWPTPIVWTMEVGTHISTGRSLAATPENNPVRVIYGLHGDDQHNSLRDGRQSWDLTASWLAVRGPGELWDVSSGGFWKVDTRAGGGQWVNGPATNQGYVMVKMPVPEVTRLIEAELSRPPSPDRK